MPGADFVIGQADFLLGDLEAFLNGPTPAGDLREAGQRGPVGAEDDVVGEVLRVLAAAPDQQPMILRRLLQSGQTQAGPVVEPFPFAASARRETPPGAGWQAGGQA